MSARDSHVNGATAKASRTDRERRATTATDNTTTEITVDQAVRQILDLLDSSYLDVDEPSIYYNNNNNRSITHRIAVTHHRDDLRDVLDMDGYRIVEVDGTDVLYEQTDTPDPGHEPLRFWVYVSVPTVYVADDPADTLWNASIGPCWTPAYREAEDQFNADLDRLEAEQDALAKAYGEAWLAAASRVAQNLGIKVDAIVTRDAAEIHSQLVMNGPLADLPDLVYEVWQAAHDLLGVEVNDDGTWEITS